VMHREFVDSAVISLLEIKNSHIEVVDRFAFDQSKNIIMKFS